MRAIASYADTPVCCPREDVCEVVRVHPAPARGRGDGGFRLTSALRPGPEPRQPRPRRNVLTEWHDYEAQAERAIAGATSVDELDRARVAYLGRKSDLAQALRGVRDPRTGALLNGIRRELEAAVAERERSLADEELERRLREEVVDVTLPGEELPLG